MKFNQTTAPTTGATPGSPSPLTDLGASGNPNYPAAVKGDRYRITVAGKVGGASGKAVEAGDVIEAVADNAGGTEAAVGTSWIAMQANIAGMTAAGLAMIQATTAAAQQVLVGITGGGALATGGFTLTVPATGTAALLGTAQTFSAANIFTVNGAASAPALSLTGTPFTGGTSTTTKPLALIETAGTTSTGWNTDGTMLGVNAPSGFTGNVFDFQITGFSGIRGVVNSAGNSVIYLGQRGARIDTTADYYLSIVSYFGNVVTQDSGGNTSLGTTGVTVGNATIGFYGVSPIARATTAVAASTFAANTSLIANDTATWDSYTIGQVVKALRNVGILT